MSLKEAVARRDGIMPFVVQKEALKAKYQKWEHDLKERDDRVEATEIQLAQRVATTEARLNQREAELDQREESLAGEEVATSALLDEAEQTVGKFVQAQEEISSLREQIASAADEHATYVNQTDSLIQSLRCEIEAEQQKREEAVAGETDARAELAALAASNRENGKERDKAVARNSRVESDLERLKGKANSLKEQLRETEAQKAASERNAKSLESAKDKLNAKIQRLEENIEKLRSTKPTASQRKLARDLASLQTEHAKTCEHLQSAWNLVATKTRDITGLRSAKAASERRCRSLESEINELQAENGRLSDAKFEKTQTIKKLRSDLKTIREKKRIAAPSFSLTDLDLLQELSREVSELFSPPAEIVTLGSGPFDEYEFDRYLESLRIKPCSSGPSWIIIGRENWSEEGLNELLDGVDPDDVQVFSQELFMAGILTTHDPFSLPLEILMKFAEGHPAIQYLIDQGFEWPEIVLEEDYGEPVYLRGSYERVEESPLFRMGYQVGITHGQPRSTRRSLLKNAYLGEIPEVEDDNYMEEWSLPGWSKRLWRIAHHIAWLIRSRQTIPSMRYAVRDWQDDLDWMEEQFYTNRMRFIWPHG